MNVLCNLLLHFNAGKVTVGLTQLHQSVLEGNPAIQFCLEILDGEVEREFTVVFQNLALPGSAIGR